MVLFENVQVPGPDDLYCALTVMLPVVRPVSSDAADARCNEALAKMTAFRSEATTVFAPLTAYDMKHDVEPVLLVMPLATETSTFPDDAGTVTVTHGREVLVPPPAHAPDPPRST
jgi:hypothetical protein